MKLFDLFKTGKKNQTFNTSISDSSTESSNSTTSTAYFAQVPENNNDNDIQNLAIDIFEQAYKLKATGIHIKDLGTHCLIRFCIMGKLSDYSNLDAKRGVMLIRGIYDTMCGTVDSHFSNRERQDARIVNKSFLPTKVYSIRVHTEATESKDFPDGIGSCMYLRLLYITRKNVRIIKGSSSVLLSLE